MQGGPISEHMIRRHGQQYRVTPVTTSLQGCEGKGRGRVPPRGLQDDACAVYFGGNQLTSGEKTVLDVAYEHRRCQRNAFWQSVQTQHGVLEQGELTVKSQKLFRIGFTRQRPQPGAGTSTQDDRNQCVLHEKGQKRSASVFAAALTAWKLTRSKLGEPWRQTLRRTRRRRLDTGIAVRHFFNALYLCPYTRQPRLHRVSFPQSEGSAVRYDRADQSTRPRCDGISATKKCAALHCFSDPWGPGNRTALDSAVKHTTCPYENRAVALLICANC